MAMTLLIATLITIMQAPVSYAQTSMPAATAPTLSITSSEHLERLSGTAFLSPQLQALQHDAARNPASLWIERGQTLWQTQCIGCHANPLQMSQAVASFPKMREGHLINLEDQILRCLPRVSLSQSASQSPIQTSAPISASSGASSHSSISLTQTAHSLESETVLSLSAALHQQAQGTPWQVQAVEPHISVGARLYQQRIGRINLACAHCHDEKVGAQMRADVISPAHPTGFPIYRFSWQSLGSIDRRLRACYSGVQAPLPAPGSLALRQLELYLKVRAKGMLVEGPSVRR